MESTGYPEVDAALAHWVTLMQASLKDGLQAVFLTGSLAYGGYIPGSSDVNGWAFLSAAAMPPACRGFGNASRWFARLRPGWARRLAIRPVPAAAGPGCLSPVEAALVHDHGRLLAGADLRRHWPRPTHADMQDCLRAEAHQAAGAGRLHGLPMPRPGRPPAHRYRHHPGSLLEMFLYPARCLYTYDTGGFADKRGALAHLRATYGERLGPGARAALGGPVPADVHTLHAAAGDVWAVYLECLGCPFPAHA